MGRGKMQNECRFSSTWTRNFSSQRNQSLSVETRGRVFVLCTRAQCDFACWRTFSNDDVCLFLLSRGLRNEKRFALESEFNPNSLCSLYTSSKMVHVAIYDVTHLFILLQLSIEIRQRNDPDFDVFSLVEFRFRFFFSLFQLNFESRKYHVRFRHTYAGTMNQDESVRRISTNAEQKEVKKSLSSYLDRSRRFLPFLRL